MFEIEMSCEMIIVMQQLACLPLETRKLKSHYFTYWWHGGDGCFVRNLVLVDAPALFRPTVLGTSIDSTQ